MTAEPGPVLATGGPLPLDWTPGGLLHLPADVSFPDDGGAFEAAIAQALTEPIDPDAPVRSWCGLGATTSVEFTPTYDAPDAEAVAASARAFAAGLPAITVQFQLTARAFQRLADVLGFHLEADQAAHDRWADDGGPTPDDQEPTR